MSAPVNPAVVEKVAREMFMAKYVIGNHRRPHADENRISTPLKGNESQCPSTSIESLTHCASPKDLINPAAAKGAP